MLVIDASVGAFEAGFAHYGQSREHAMIAQTMAVKQMIIAVNKMDDYTVQYSETRFN